MRLFDSHCHLQLEQYDADRAEVLTRMQEKGMGAVLIGVDYNTSKAALELAKQHDFLWTSVGLHPNDNQKEQWLDISSQMEELAQDPKVVAIGECGLDYFRSGGTPEEKTAQKDKFVLQMQLAQKIGKTLIIHCRNASDDMLALLAEHKPTVPVVIHFFTGKKHLAKQYLELGCYLSFPGPITYTNMYDDAVSVCPIDKMLIETDSPFAAPVPYRGKRNEPSYVEHVAAKIAHVKGLTAEDVCTRTLQNAKEAFRLHK